MNKRIRKKCEKRAKSAEDFILKIVKSFSDVAFSTTETALSIPCPQCKNNGLVRTSALGYGPYGGSVMCCSCNYRDSFMCLLGRSIIKIDPMPEGTKEIYMLNPRELAEDK